MQRSEWYGFNYDARRIRKIWILRHWHYQRRPRLRRMGFGLCSRQWPRMDKSEVIPMCPRLCIDLWIPFDEDMEWFNE